MVNFYYKYFIVHYHCIGAVYVLGLGDYKDGCLGKDIAENQKVPKVLPLLPQIKLATCGSDNSFFVTETRCIDINTPCTENSKK